MGSRLPLTALDIQLELLRHYTSTSLGRMYADSILEAGLKQEENVPPGMGRHVHQMMLGAGATYAITSDIVDVLEQMAPKLPSFIMHQQDLPSPHGFVWLERPILVADIRENNLVVHGFGWTTVDARYNGADEPAVLMLAWTDPNDARDHAAAWDDRGFMDAAPHGMLSMLAGFYPFGIDWRADKPDYEPGDLGRFWLTFLRFIAAPWVATETHTPDRSQARRALRTLDHVPEIHVVQLRRRRQTRTEPTGETRTVDWKNRWIVGDHWRDQWYPSLQCHKPIPIVEYIKGPDNKPLVVHDRVFSVER